MRCSRMRAYCESLNIGPAHASRAFISRVMQFECGKKLMRGVDSRKTERKLRKKPRKKKRSDFFSSCLFSFHETNKSNERNHMRLDVLDSSDRRCRRRRRCYCWCVYMWFSGLSFAFACICVGSFWCCVVNGISACELFKFFLFQQQQIGPTFFSSFHMSQFKKRYGKKWKNRTQWFDG